MEINFIVLIVINIIVYNFFVKENFYDNSYSYTFVISFVLYIIFHKLDLIKTNNYTEKFNLQDKIVKPDIDQDYKRMFPTAYVPSKLVKENHKLDESIFGYGYYDDHTVSMEQDISKSFPVKIPTVTNDDIPNDKEISGYIPSSNPGYIPNYKAKNINPKKNNSLYTADSIRFI